MKTKISKTNPSLEFLNARLDQVRMSGVERLRAKASLARAEALADLVVGLAGAVKRFLKIFLVRPIRRLTSTLG